MNPFKYAIETLVMEREKERATVREINREFDKHPDSNLALKAQQHTDLIKVLDESIQILHAEGHSLIEQEDREAEEVPF